MAKQGNNQMDKLVMLHHVQHVAVVQVVCVTVCWFMMKRMLNRKKARVCSEVNVEEFEVLREGLQAVAEAFMKSTAELVKPNRLPIDEAKVWAHLEEFELGDLIVDAYAFLVDKPEKFRALLACPPQRRKDVLNRMMRLQRREDVLRRIE